MGFECTIWFLGGRKARLLSDYHGMSLDCIGTKGMAADSMFQKIKEISTIRPDATI